MKETFKEIRFREASQTDRHGLFHTGYPTEQKSAKTESLYITY